MYRKELYVFDQDKPVKAMIRNYTPDDFDELIRIQQESFPPPFPSELWWNKEQLTNHVTLFPEGAVCVEVDGVLAGSITGLLVTFDPAHPDHTWEEVTDSGYIRNHDPNGDTLYIVDICIRPSHRKLGLGKWMMQAMYELVVHKGLKRLLGGGRMPGYGRYADQMTAEAYLEKVVAGDLKDPVVTFLMRCGRTPLKVVANYLEDEESRNYAALMEWKNPFMSATRQ
ncbi:MULTISPECIES: GNAT family N-acetyltransferase [Brevibacillus]|jgi:ribosomal protein S18 acetylase RimI-like enzyme|uniref:Acetyltransferase n=1 Tax=Brevibacillus aydinogluensis TaxID=927786 RepID=A0AA48RHV3_9BACL|nr:MULTISPECIES: GNAT family N-acetyltransferase [Brevibacillus]MBR8658460.1 GNAT family N-acetyltransferase [Brevibacillus sp. NL20B1]NNV02055.1 GNAT family N-acetyltransferase [Brevibacillus sp. MCWH]CAJ1002746.1 Acetyltransferase [Brevibacillus aydinogluensis]